jgi:hypothetical protein
LEQKLKTCFTFAKRNANDAYFGEEDSYAASNDEFLAFGDIRKKKVLSNNFFDCSIQTVVPFENRGTYFDNFRSCHFCFRFKIISIRLKKKMSNLTIRN